MSADFNHIPVLKDSVLEYLTFPTDRPARLIDGTIGGAGHSSALLEKYPNLELLGVDRDETALSAASQRLAPFGDRVNLRHGNYSEMVEIADSIGWKQVDGVLLDIGVSSPQIDIAERGFAWRLSGPLDMRMDRTSRLTAARILNNSSEAELAKIFFEYGEIPQARRLAAEIVIRRETTPFAMTEDLVTLCDDVLGKSREKHRLPAPTLVFQALRIAVNDELNELKKALDKIDSLLSPDGVVAIITFHSLEDRIVKNYYRLASTDCVCPPGLPVCVCGHRATYKILTKKPIVATESELAVNRRAASAKLRVAQKLAGNNLNNK